MMNTSPPLRIRRFLCAFCALFCFVSVLLPVAAQAAGAPGATDGQELTAAQAEQMRAADDAVAALTESEDFQALTPEQRGQAALAELEALAGQGLVQPGSIYLDEENGLVSFAYTCGALGGLWVTPPQEQDNSLDLDTAAPAALSLLDEENYTAVGNAIIYYAFDNTVNSNRYPYYAYMQAFWTSVGMPTALDTTVTVADLRRMNQYNICLISAHGAYYTYTSGLFWKRLRTVPLLILPERSSTWNDLRYGMELLCQRVIKIGGFYCVTPDFFRAAYHKGQLHSTIILSEACEFFGVDGSIDDSMAQALLDGGAPTVVGFVNSVYSAYSRSMMWDVVNQFIQGRTIQQALQHAMELYGTDDIVWYTSRGGQNPHLAAAYPLLYGDPEIAFATPRPQEQAPQAA